MFVKPGQDEAGMLLKVRIPYTHALLADEGQEVPGTAFWLRRIAHGDVVLATPTADVMKDAQ
jgi:hypothetical protein